MREESARDDAGRTPFGINLAVGAVVMVAVAGIGYLIFNGFLPNRLGEATWNGMTNLWHLIIFALAIGLGVAGRRVRAMRADLALARDAAGLVSTADTNVIDKKEALRG